MAHFGACWDPCPTVDCGRRGKQAKAVIPFLNIVSSDDNDAHEKSTKEMSEFVMREEFVKRTTEKSMFNEIKRLVNCAKAAQANDLDQKRERLRKLLTDEETQFEAEFQLAMSRRIENDIEARRDHLLSLKIEREEKRKRFVEDKRMQLIIERCDAVRPIMQQQLLEESKRVQLYQIEERKSLKAMAKDYDNMWHDVGLKRQMEQDRVEAEKSRMAYMNAKCIQEELKQQIAAQRERNQRDKHDAFINTCCVKGEIFPVEKDEEKSEHRARCVQYAQDLLAQQEEKRVLKLRELKESNDFDAVILATCKSEIEKEELAIKNNKKNLMKESWQYLNYLKGMQCERKMNELELDNLLAEVNRNMEKQSNSRCAEQAKKREFEKLVHAERRIQIEQRAQDRCNDCNNRICEAIIEREINSRQLEEDRLKAANKLKRNIEFAKGLLEQSAQINRRRLETNQAINDEAAKSALEDEHKCDKVIEMIRSGQAKLLYPQHPNKWVLDNYRNNNK